MTDADQLRARVQRFIRGFGVLHDAQTPCGKPLSTSHAHALMILLVVKDEGLHQAELSRQLGIDKSNGSRLVQHLVDKGHVAVTAVQEDARIKRVRLTARGARIARGVDLASRERFSHLLAAIPTRHRKSVLAALDHLTQALERP